MRCRVAVFRFFSVSVLLALFLVPAARADVSVPSVFASHMVLQRDGVIPVWGTAAPGEAVEVALAEQRAETVAGADGTWRVDLAPLPAGGPFTLTIRGANRLVFEDVLVGEVWLCSGQSNMQWAVKQSLNGAEEAASADLPRIRLFSIPRVAASLPAPDVKASWEVCAPATVTSFSAVGFFFGRELARELDVPIGLINSSWGGTRIEPWTPPEGFAGVPALDGIHRQVQLAMPSAPMHKEALGAYLTGLEGWLEQSRRALVAEEHVSARPEYPKELALLEGRTTPTTLYNGMIAPIVPFALRGAIWYQGESNCGERMLYFEKMKALIGGWRQIWGRGDFPFYYVQLAPFTYRNRSPRELPRMWEAQRAALALPNTGMAVINDVGNIGNIHPTNKQEVGRRLSLLALRDTYGREDVVARGPDFREMAIEGTRVRVRFDHTGSGLTTRDGAAPSHFEILDAEAGVLPATTVIEGNDVICSSPAAVKPVGVRYAWDQTAEPNLMNREGLPVSAFRAGEDPVRNDLQERIPAAAGYRTVYRLDIPASCGYGDRPVEYAVDNTGDLEEPYDRIAYCLELRKAGAEIEYVFVSMPAFATDPKKIGVPTVQAGEVFQQEVGSLDIASNVAGIPTGEGVGVGSVEFWPSNYGPGNDKQVAGASGSTFDFGDSTGRVEKGYGSMQVHLPSAKLTVLAFNRWGPGGGCEVGIGNSPEGNPDWTFRNNGGDYELRRLTVLVRPDF